MRLEKAFRQETEENNYEEANRFVRIRIDSAKLREFGSRAITHDWCNQRNGCGPEGCRNGERSAMGNVGCDALALLTLVLGIAVGAVLTYIPFAFRITTLRRRIERLKSSVL